MNSNRQVKELINGYNSDIESSLIEKVAKMHVGHLICFMRCENHTVNTE